MTIISGVVSQGGNFTDDHTIQGPMDPSQYEAGVPGVGGPRVLAANASLGVDIITFDNPEVDFATSLGGTAAVAPLSPLKETLNKEVIQDDQPSEKARVYTVQPGDTIGGIAEKFDVSTSTILWANGLSASTTIRVGDHLTILPFDGLVHVVKSGDTLIAIANEYDVEVKDITEANNMESGDTLSLNQKLTVPGGKIKRRAPQVVTRGTRIAAREPDGPTPEPAKVGSGFAWPTTTRHLSQYFKWGHTGIDIDNRSRPPIYAAEAGTIEFAGWLGAYGNLIIMNHGGGLQTYYAHLDAFYAKKGATVAKGAAIGKMGSTGRSTGPHVHFEVRRNGRPINPLSMY